MTGNGSDNTPEAPKAPETQQSLANKVLLGATGDSRRAMTEENLKTLCMTGDIVGATVFFVCRDGSFGSFKVHIKDEVLDKAMSAGGEAAAWAIKEVYEGRGDKLPFKREGVPEWPEQPS